MLQERCASPPALSEKGGADTGGPYRGISEKQIPHTARKRREQVRDDSVVRGMRDEKEEARDGCARGKFQVKGASGFPSKIGAGSG